MLNRKKIIQKTEKRLNKNNYTIIHNKNLTLKRIKIYQATFVPYPNQTQIHKDAELSHNCFILTDV